MMAAPKYSNVTGAQIAQWREEGVLWKEIARRAGTNEHAVYVKFRCHTDPEYRAARNRKNREWARRRAREFFIDQIRQARAARQPEAIEQAPQGAPSGAPGRLTRQA